MGNIISCDNGEGLEHRPSVIYPKVPVQPSDEEVDARYYKLLQGRGVPEAVREEMTRIENTKAKWYLVYFGEEDFSKEVPSSLSAISYVDQLLVFQYGGDGLIDLLRSIRLSITTNSKEWVEEFLSNGGLDALTMFLPGAKNDPDIDTTHCNEILKVLTTLANYGEGINQIIKTPGCTMRIWMCFEKNHLRVKTRTIQLLGVVCYHNHDGYIAVLTTFNEFKSKKREGARFQTLLDSLKQNPNNTSFKVNLLTFINIFLNATIELEDRVAIRNDLCFNGFLELLDEFRNGYCGGNKSTDESLETQINVFDKLYNEDRKNTLHNQVDLTNMEQIFDVLYGRTVNTDVQAYFLQILNSLLSVPSERRFGKEMWKVVAESISKITSSCLNERYMKDLNFIKQKKILSIRDEVDKLLTQKNKTEIAKKNLRIILPSTSSSSVSSLFSPDSVVSSVSSNPPDTFSEESSVCFSPTSDSNNCPEKMTPKGQVKIKDHPKYEKYFRLLRMGMPIAHIQLKAESEDKLDKKMFDLDEDTLIDIDDVAKDNEEQYIAAKNHPKYFKYFKMVQLKIPIEFISQKMMADNLNSELLQTPEKLIPVVEDASKDSENVDKKEDEKVTVKNHPKYSRFFKLLSMGTPLDIVKAKMTQAGLNENLIDTPDAEIQTESVKEEKGSVVSLLFKKKKHLHTRSKSDVSMLQSNEISKLKDGSRSNQNSPLAKRRSMRCLYWEVVDTENLSGTIWDDDSCIDEIIQSNDEKLTNNSTSSIISTNIKAKVESLDKITSIKNHTALISEHDVAEMEKLFPVKKTTPLVPGRSQTISSPIYKASSKVTLIDRSRSNNISIMLKRFKMSCNEIQEAVMKLDSKITLERANVLLQISPTVEEIAAVNSYSGDYDLLNEPEKIIKVISSIPRFQTRLESLVSKLQFGGLVADFENKMKLVTSTCEEVVKCKKFGAILKIVLEMGNHMNEGTSRGGARGFRLSDLTKLGQLKGVDNSTLVHYLARILRMKDQANLIAFGDEMPHLEDIQIISISELQPDFSKIASVCALIEKEIKFHEKINNKTPNDQFQSVMKPFLSYAEQTNNHIEKTFELTNKKIHSTIAYFEKPSQDYMKEASSFFRVIFDFSQVLAKADRENELARVQKERKALREKQALLRREAKMQKLQQKKYLKQGKENLNVSPEHLNESIRSDNNEDDDSCEHENLSRESSLRDIGQFSTLMSGNMDGIIQAYDLRRHAVIEKDQSEKYKHDVANLKEIGTKKRTKSISALQNQVSHLLLPKSGNEKQLSNDKAATSNIITYPNTITSL